MSTAEGLTLPKPGVPKTLGILNIIFGILLTLLGLFGLVVTLLLPVLFQGIEKVAKDERVKAEAAEKAQQKDFDDRIAAATTDEEKKAIEQEKANVPPRPMMNPVDLSFATDVFKDRKIMFVNNAGILSGLIVHIMLLIAGVGLIRLAPWGRTLSLWFAVLQIAQIIALLIGTIIYVLPANQANMEKMFAKAEEQAKKQGGPGAAGAAGTAQMTKLMGAVAVPMAVAQSLTGMVYPVVLLIMLNGAGARAACLRKKPTNIEDF
jgi:hypothetical protein